MSYRIVVGMDFDLPSQHALLHAYYAVSAAPHGELHLVHVVPDAHPDRRGHIEKDETLMADAMKKLRELLVEENAKDTEGEPSDRKVNYHVRLANSVAEGLEQVALDVNAHLVVVGTHGRKGLEKMVLGSVAQSLLNNGRVPLLVARPTNFEGMEKTAQIDPPHPDQVLEARQPGMIWSTERMGFRGGRGRRISGLV